MHHGKTRRCHPLSKSAGQPHTGGVPDAARNHNDYLHDLTAAATARDHDDDPEETDRPRLPLPDTPFDLLQLPFR